MSVLIERWHPGGTNAHNQTVDAWDPPASLAVIGIAPVASSETPTQGSNRVADRATLYVLEPVSHKDRVTIDGEVWQVDGDAADWNRGPYGWQPGFTVTVRRWRG